MRVLIIVIIFGALLGYATPSAAQVEPPEMTATALIQRATQQAAIERATQQALENVQLQLDGTRQVLTATEVAQNAEIAQSAANSASTIIATTLGIIGIFGVILAFFATRRVLALNQRIDRAQDLAKDDPQKAKLAWDLARVTLESYFNRNISQITWIFWLSVVVMALGFLIITFSIFLVILYPDQLTPAVITTIVGGLTEFIGATFLFVYRSTIQQALNYFVTLEKINSVGMAMQILDTMPDGAVSDDLKNQTKATLITLMIQQSGKEPAANKDKQE